MPLAPGYRVGDYEILALECWMCAPPGRAIYRARETRGEKVDKDVVMHVLHLDLTAPDELARFERESRALQALAHPNIATILDFGTQEGFAYAVEKLLEGETLRERLKAGAIPQKQAVDYMLQVARGLSAGHERGVVHGDLKPDNLFVTRDGHVKILDFGWRLLETIRIKDASAATGSDYAPTGMLVGTAGYISPEQIRGKPPDARSDIFSFGAILYETLAGKRAFPGDSAAESLVATLKMDPPDLSPVTQGVSPGLRRLVRHCLEKDPEQRFQSVRDLAFDLAALSNVSDASQGPEPGGPMDSGNPTGARASPEWAGP
jgi:serine/threonine protein kinase